ncbi:carbonate dehydratase [Zooshikella harenae]|uniref:Carbonic anhydrase n=1 Tax=Zooshikella harenae TaxID=2827238 RepID=A0ABS5ZFT5_9GAMM|nr:carbonate dehydratase [Zooshikella harenae]MBU2712914.1 carbonate dehydratase [Zooshikella harenae]
MKTLKPLFDKNQAWAARVTQESPDFFANLSAQQSPEILWIGCSDSRVPANQIVDMEPGQLFVHRNIANQVIQSDLNCLSVVEYAVNILKIKHIIICGHYGCGGVQAAYDNIQNGLVAYWLAHIRDIYLKHQTKLTTFSKEDQLAKLYELNVIEQVYNLCRTPVIQKAWQRDQTLSIHGWIYSLHTGLITDLSVCVTHENELEQEYSSAIETCYQSESKC